MPAVSNQNGHLTAFKLQQEATTIAKDPGSRRTLPRNQAFGWAAGEWPSISNHQQSETILRVVAQRLNCSKAYSILLLEKKGVTQNMDPENYIGMVPGQQLHQGAGLRPQFAETVNFTEGPVVGTRDKFNG